MEWGGGACLKKKKKKKSSSLNLVIKLQCVNILRPAAQRNERVSANVVIEPMQKIS